MKLKKQNLNHKNKHNDPNITKENATSKISQTKHSQLL